MTARKAPDTQPAFGAKPHPNVAILRDGIPTQLRLLHAEQILLSRLMELYAKRADITPEPSFALHALLAKALETEVKRMERRK